MMRPVWRRLLVLAGLLVSSGLLLSAGPRKKPPPSHPIDLNRASATELERVPGVGPATAKAIIEFRQKSGPFRSVDDLLSVRGIGPKKLARMRPYLTVGPGEKPKSENRKSKVEKRKSRTGDRGAAAGEG
jgi:competence ComEA-like helix-hairpin-helix protein